jgi:hypothetical protein
MILFFIIRYPNGGQGHNVVRYPMAFILDLNIRTSIIAVSKDLNTECGWSQIDFIIKGVYPMHLRDNRFIKATFFLMIAAFTLAGCSGRLFTYKGDKITQKNLMVPLKDGDQKGVWKTNELAITYQYQMTPEILKIAGTTELLGGFAIGFSWIKHLAVNLLFLDNQGIVIENALIYSAGNHRSIDTIPMDFEKTIPIPEGARTISFAYEGELRGSGTEDQTAYNIWFSPSRQ